MTKALLKCQNFSLKAGTYSLLVESSLNAYSGQTTLLLGLNGCGKTMLLRSLCGLSDNLDQEILLDGHPSTKLSVIDRAKILSFLPQFPQIYEHMLVKEYLKLCRFAFDYDYEDTEHYSRSLGIEELVTKSMGILSGGELKKVALMGCLIQEPKILVLDEPFQHLDPAHKSLFINILKDQKRKGIAVVMTSHDFSWSLPFADSVYGFYQKKLIQDRSADFLSKVFDYPFDLQNGQILPVIKGDQS